MVMSDKERVPIYSELDREAIFFRLNSLNAGETVMLYSVRYPESLMRTVGERLTGRLDWHPLEQGPKRWRIRFLRKSSPEWEG